MSIIQNSNNDRNNSYSKQSDGILFSARPSHKSESESDGFKSGLRSTKKKEDNLFYN